MQNNTIPMEVNLTRSKKQKITLACTLYLSNVTAIPKIHYQIPVIIYAYGYSLQRYL